MGVLFPGTAPGVYEAEKMQAKYLTEDYRDNGYLFISQRADLTRIFNRNMHPWLLTIVVFLRIFLSSKIHAIPIIFIAT